MFCPPAAATSSARKCYWQCTPHQPDRHKRDLRKLITVEEAYYADPQKYTSTLSNCAPPAPRGSAYFCPTSGNVLGMLTVSARGWTATITNVHMTNP